MSAVSSRLSTRKNPCQSANKSNIHGARKNMDVLFLPLDEERVSKAIIVNLSDRTGGRLGVSEGGINVNENKTAK